MSLYLPYLDRSRSVTRALSPFVNISELDDDNRVISRQHYSYRSGSLSPLLYDSTVSRRNADWFTSPSYSYGGCRDIFPYRGLDDWKVRLNIRTPPPITNYLQPIYKTYRHYSSPHYHHHHWTQPAPQIRHETYSPVYHYHIEPPRTRTTTTTRIYRKLPTVTYTPVLYNHYYSRLFY